jgi:hypothetical protein
MAKLPIGNKIWSDRINARWDAAAGGAIKGFIETGILLEQAHANLGDTEYDDMLEKRLRFGIRTAEKLRALAKHDEWLATHVSLLPPHWSTLYDVTRLPLEVRDNLIKDGTINPDMERKDVPKPRQETAGRTKPRPKVTDAEYHDVTASPDPKPEIGDATDSQPREEVPEASRGKTAPAAEEDPVEAGGAEWKPPHFDAAMKAMEQAERVALGFSPSDAAGKAAVPPRDGMDPASMFANGLTIAMAAHGVLSGHEFARCWPNDLPLLSDELSKFCDWLLVFEEEYRLRYGDGNDAALRAAE